MLLTGGVIGLWPSQDRIVSLQKLAVMALAAALVLHVGRLRPVRQLGLVWALLVAGLAASVAGDVLVDRASWKLDALNRPVYALFAHVPRFSDLAFSQNGLAAFLVLVIPFGVALAIQPRWRMVAAALTTGLMFELLVTEARAAMLSLGLALGLFALFRRGRWRWLALAVPGLALALLASGLVALPMTLSWLPTGGSSAERLAIWQSSLLMIADTPVTGIGLGMFQRVYPLYILPAYHNIHPHAHNLFLQTYLDAGPLGCAGMLVLAGAGVAATLRLWRNPPANQLQWTIGAGAAVSCAAVFLHAQVDSYFAGDPRTYFVMFLPLGLLLGVSPGARRGWRRREALAGSMIASGLLLLAMPWLVPAFWSNVGSVERIRGGDARSAFEHALALQPRNWVAERGLGLLGSTKWLQQAIHDGAPGQLVHAELAQRLQPEAALPEWRVAGAAPYLVRQARATTDPDERERLLLTALQVDPNQAGAHQQLAELYLSQSRFPEARAVLKEWHDASYAKLLLGLMDYWLDGDIETASKQLQDAPEGAQALADMRQDAAGQPPAGTAAVDTLGRAYEALGLDTQAEAEFRHVSDPIGHYDLGRLRIAQGEPEAALSQLRLAVRAIPNQEDFRLALARLYVQIGGLGDAKREYRVVLDLDPGNTEAQRAVA